MACSKKMEKTNLEEISQGFGKESEDFYEDDDEQMNDVGPDEEDPTASNRAGNLKSNAKTLVVIKRHLLLQTVQIREVFPLRIDQNSQLQSRTKLVNLEGVERRCAKQTQYCCHESA